jgi:hypothetical protein
LVQERQVVVPSRVDRHLRRIQLDKALALVVVAEAPSADLKQRNHNT